MKHGLVIAAPSSGQGKTIVTMGLLRALSQRGIKVQGLKCGPDYIDPAFHHLACGRVCYNLDSWAMPSAFLQGLAGKASGEICLIEGVMGLFDGAAIDSTNNGSTASVAQMLNLPVVLVISAKGMAQTAGALIEGLANHRKGVKIAGVIFNHCGGDGHREMLLKSLPSELIPLGFIPKEQDLSLGSRHLGLIQAGEYPELENILENIGRIIAKHVDVKALLGLAQPLKGQGPTHLLPPLGQRIAVASDSAFAFCYPALLEGWQEMGAEIELFSPLKGDKIPNADAIYLPGGYPELHASALTRSGFLKDLRKQAEKGKIIYGECGGYMVLGQSLKDSAGQNYEMAGLLPLESDFSKPKLHLGYREVVLEADCPLGGKGTQFRGHEFHYSRCFKEENNHLFRAKDAKGKELEGMGTKIGQVMGSFVHLISRHV